MYKKLIYMLSICGLCFFVQPGNANTVSQNFNKLYIEMGVDAYYLNNPVFDVGTSGNSSAALAKITDNGFVPKYHFAVGHRVNSDKNSVIGKVFGTKDKIELNLDYFNTHQSKRKHSLGEGKLWLIDNTIIGGFGQDDPYPLEDFNLRSRNRFTSVGLYFRGHHVTSNSKLTFDPYVGLIHTDYISQDNFTVAYLAPARSIDSEDYYVQTEYFGAAFGNKIDFAITPKLTSFLDLEIQLLRADAKLTAHQDGDVGMPEWVTRYRKDIVTSDHNDITYRGILSLGLTYKFINNIAMTFKLGIDRWGYNPKIITPDNTTSGPVHLVGESDNNAFASLEVYVPLA